MATKLKKIDKLIKIIKQWNSDRLDLFEISLPNEDGEFFGVMRFYFQEEGEKVATKCIRITSTATTLQVIDTLIEKFRPDLRLLSRPNYSLYEIHINGDERQLEDDEKPLLVQLNWNKDDREGRFLLKREDERSTTGYYQHYQGTQAYSTNQETFHDPRYETFSNHHQHHHHPHEPPTDFFTDTDSAACYPGEPSPTFLKQSFANNPDPELPSAQDQQNRHSFFTNSLFSNSTLFRNKQQQQQLAVTGTANKHQQNPSFDGQDSNNNQHESMMGRTHDQSLISSNIVPPPSFNKGNVSSSNNTSFGAAVREKATNTFRRSKNKKKEKSSSSGKASNTKESKKSIANGNINTSPPETGPGKISDKLYQAMPDTLFTRSISNPEAVMRRRRQQKLEKKLKLIQSLDQRGGVHQAQILSAAAMTGANHHDQVVSMLSPTLNSNSTTNPLDYNGGNGIITSSGGMLKIYGESLKPGIPYKTLLLTNHDNAAFVVKEILDKYGMMFPHYDPHDFCLFKARLPTGTPSSEVSFNYHGLLDQYILEDTDIPLMLYYDATATTLASKKAAKNGEIIFYVSRRPSNYTEVLTRQRELKASRRSSSLYSVPVRNSSYGHPNGNANMPRSMTPTTPYVNHPVGAYVNHHQQQHHIMLNEFDHHSAADSIKEDMKQSTVTPSATFTVLNDSVSIIVTDFQQQPIYSHSDNFPTSNTTAYHQLLLSIDPNAAAAAPCVDNNAAGLQRRYPLLVELNPDGNEITHRIPFIYNVTSNMVEIGSQDPPHDGDNTFLQLKGDDIFPKHCLLTLTNKETVYVTPCKPEAVIYVDGKLVRESTLIRNNACVRFGLTYAFRFLVKPPQNASKISPLSQTASNPGSAPGASSPSSTSFNKWSTETIKTSNLLPPADIFKSSFRDKLFKLISEDEKLPAFLEISYGVKMKDVVQAIFHSYLPASEQSPHLAPNNNNNIGQQQKPNAVLYAWGSTFKLSLGYLIYLCCRSFHYRRLLVLQHTQFHNDPFTEESLMLPQNFLNKLMHVFDSGIEAHKDNPLILTFWIANLSEIVYALTRDRQLNTNFTTNSSNSLATTTTNNNVSSPSFEITIKELRTKCLNRAFYLLTKKLCFDIATLLPYLFQPPPPTTNITTLNNPPSPSINPSDQETYDEKSTKSSCAPIVKTLNSLMNMLKQHRLNSAISIQIFGRIFKFMESWTINTIFTNVPYYRDSYSNSLHTIGPVLRQNEGSVPINNMNAAALNNYPPFSRDWGFILQTRVREIICWAEHNGLEISIESHFQKLEQVLKLLKMPKYHVHDLSQLTSSCFKLNSRQVYTVLDRYRYSPGEPTIPNLLVEKFVNIAHNTTDEVLSREMMLRQPLTGSTENPPTTSPISLLENDAFWNALHFDDSNSSSTNDKNKLSSRFITTPDDDINFSFPDEGYSFDIVKGVPDALITLIEKFLTEKGIAKLITLPQNGPQTPNDAQSIYRDGSWNAHFIVSRDSSNFSDISSSPKSSLEVTPASQHHNSTIKNESLHEIVNEEFSTTVTAAANKYKTVCIAKTERGLGLSIIAAQPYTDSELGIYVRAVIPGGAAEIAGAPYPGDQIIAVNGISLVGVDEEIAANIMTRAGKCLTLTYLPSSQFLASSLNNENQLGKRLNGGAYSVSRTELRNIGGRSPSDYHTLSLEQSQRFAATPQRNTESSTVDVIKKEEASSSISYGNFSIPSSLSVAANNFSHHKRYLSAHEPISNPNPNLPTHGGPYDTKSFYDHQSTAFNRKNDSTVKSNVPNPTTTPDLASFMLQHKTDMSSSIPPKSLKRGGEDFYGESSCQPKSLLAERDYHLSHQQQQQAAFHLSQSMAQKLQIQTSSPGGSHGFRDKFRHNLTTNAFGSNNLMKPFGDRSSSVASSEKSSSSSKRNVIEGNEFLKMGHYTPESSKRDHQDISEQFSSHESPLMIRSFHDKLKTNSDEHPSIGAREKIAFCQEMINELKSKGEQHLNVDECERLKALVMEYEFQRRVLEEEELLSDEEDTTHTSEPPTNNISEKDQHHTTQSSNQTDNVMKGDYFKLNGNGHGVDDKLFSGFNNSTVEERPKPPERSYASFAATSDNHNLSSEPSNTRFSPNKFVPGTVTEITKPPGETERSGPRIVRAPSTSPISLNPPMPVQYNNNNNNYVKEARMNEETYVPRGTTYETKQRQQSRREDMFDITDIYDDNNHQAIVSPTITTAASHYSSASTNTREFLTNVKAFEKEPYTPGVIGTQEVYLDPRIKLQMQKQRQQQQSLYNDHNGKASPFGDFMIHPTKDKPKNCTSRENDEKHNNNVFLATKTLNHLNEENSPERMSFRDKMKKFAQVSAQPLYQQQTNQSENFDSSHLPNSQSLTAVPSSFNFSTNNGITQSFNPLIVEKLKISKTQKKIEDTLLTTSK